MNRSAASRPRKFGFTTAQRLRKPDEFAAVRDARAVKNAGPLRVSAVPNDLPRNRLGLVISKRVGKAVQRNRLKRMIREAFRLLQHDLPTGYDLSVTARLHEPATLADYKQWLAEAVRQLDQLWRKRDRSP